MLDNNHGHLALTQSFLSLSPAVLSQQGEFTSFFWSAKPVLALKQKLCLPESYHSEHFLTAFTHQSFLHENAHWMELQDSFQRLEFLGDSVLSLIISEELFKKCSKSAEGDLTKRKGSLVSTQAFYRLACALELDQVLLVGRGVFKKFEQAQENILADCFESLFGALYLDFGLSKVSALLLDLQNQHPHLFEALSDGAFNYSSFDPKSILQEKVMALTRELPIYQAQELGQEVEVEIYFGQELIGQGKASSKREAEKVAALSALSSYEQWQRLLSNNKSFTSQTGNAGE